MANLFSVRTNAHNKPAPGSKPDRSQTTNRIDASFRKRPTGRVDHIGANHKTCHCRLLKNTGGTKERSKTMGL
jgi:hypothetical protein